MKKGILIILILISITSIHSQTAGTGFDLRNPSINLTEEEINGIAVSYAGTTDPIDLDGDGNYEFVIRADNTADQDCQIRIFEKNGDNSFVERGTGIKIGVTTRLTTQIRSIMVANVDGDSDYEIVTLTENSNTPDSRINIINVSTDGNFTMSEHTNSPIINPDDDDWSGLDYIGDLDEDGNPEFIAGDVGSTNAMVIYEWNGSGWSSVATSQPAGGVNKLAVGNLDSDSNLEIAVLNDNSGTALLEIWQVTQSGGIFTLASDGTVNNNISYNAGTKANVHIVLFDLDKDNDLEIICVSNDNDGTGSGTTKSLYVFERTTGTTYDRDITAASGLLSNTNHFIAIACGNMDADAGGEIYYSIENSGTVLFREHDGTDNDFTDSRFSSPQNLVTSMGTNIEAGALGYFGGGNFQFDGDSYRDIMVGTLTTTTNDLYFLESTVIDGVLPVTLTKFTASVIKNNVTLNWSTATETQNAGWEIERRIYKSELSKAENWKSIAFIDGSRNSNAPKNYSFTDNNVSYGQYEYRLKQIDLDGSVNYSDVILVSVGAKPTEFALYENYPNPFNPSTKIRYAVPQAGKVTLAVYNSVGQLVATLTDEFTEAGVYEKEFDGSSLSSGVYVYMLMADNVKIVKKMLLVK